MGYHAPMESQIRHSDAVELLRSLPTGSVGCIVTDPAYISLERHRKKGTTTRLKKSKASSNEWFDTVPNGYFWDFFHESYRVLRSPGHMYVFGDDETTLISRYVAQWSGFYPWKNLTWVKTREKASPEDGAELASHLAALQVYPGTGYHYPNATEKILFLEKRTKRYEPSLSPISSQPDTPGKGRRLLGGPSDREMGHAGDVFFAPRVRDGYPTEKPVSILRVLVCQSTDEGDTVVDPFCGSGSLGEAALLSRRGFILGDKSEGAVEISRRRCDRISETLRP